MFQELNAEYTIGASKDFGKFGIHCIREVETG